MNKNVINYKKSIHLSIVAQKLDKSESKTLFVLDKSNKLIGVITDGDLRRTISKQHNLKLSIDTLMSKNPITINPSQSLDEIKFLFDIHKLKAIPIVDNAFKILKIIHLKNINKISHSSNKLSKVNAVIMAGGRGTRMAPFTLVLPKPLIPIDGNPIISKIIESFNNFKLSKIHISINKHSEVLKSFIQSNNNFKKIYFSEELSMLGTVGSLTLLKKKLSNNFFLTNCDTLIKKNYLDIYNQHIKDGNVLTIVACKICDEIPYGVCEVDKITNQLIKLIEKPQRNYNVNTGFYVLNKKVVDLIPKNKKYDMNQLADKILKNNLKIGVHIINQDEWIDVGNWDEFKKSSNNIIN